MYLNGDPYRTGPSFKQRLPEKKLKVCLLCYIPISPAKKSAKFIFLNCCFFYSSSDIGINSITTPLLFGLFRVNAALIRMSFALRHSLCPLTIRFVFNILIFTHLFCFLFYRFIRFIRRI